MSEYDSRSHFDFMSQLERLYRIEQMLLNAPAVSFERLQETLEVSRATRKRDSPGPTTLGMLARVMPPAMPAPAPHAPSRSPAHAAQTLHFL